MKAITLAACLFVGASSLGQLAAQCIPFVTPTPGVITPGVVEDLRPGAIHVEDLVAEGTAMVVSPFDTYQSVVDLVFPNGLDHGHINGQGRLSTPLGDLLYRIKGDVAGDPFTQVFSWQIEFIIQGGSGIFEGATGTAAFTGTSDADSIDGITEGLLCLEAAG